MRKPDDREENTGELIRALIERDARVFLHQAGSTPAVSAIRRAGGIYLEDAGGRRMIDFQGNSVHHIGYGHPRLVEALKRQLDELPFTPRRLTDEPAIALAEKLSHIWPGAPGKVLLATGGSDAIEIALKIARVATGRYKTISFHESYHGSGFGALSVGGRANDRPPLLGPLLPGAIHVPPFYPLGQQERDDQVRESAALQCLEAMRAAIASEPDIAAIVAEPIRSTPHIPPRWFWPAVRALCNQIGALLIFDEIPTGLGKTGTLFASEHSGVVPDMTVLGKALGGGVVPIAAVIARADLDVAPDLSLGHYTHEKNPFTARAALTTLEIIESEGLVAHAAELGAAALAGLTATAEGRESIRDVRGIGLLMGVELAAGEGVDALSAEVVRQEAFRLGLNLGSDPNTITLSPPLVTTAAEMDAALSILASALCKLPGALS